MANKRVKKKYPQRAVNPTHYLLNGVIAALILVIFLFIYSLYDSRIRVENNMAAYTGADLENIPTALLIDQENRKAEVDLVVQVLNGCGVPGLAAQFQGILNRKGVDVIDVGNAPSQEYDHSTIYFYGNTLDKAFRLADMLGIDKGKIFEKEKTNLGNDLTLVLGKDYAGLDKVKIPRDEVKLQILNGCGVNGISRRYQNYFEVKGYQVIDVRNARNFRYDRTELQYSDPSYSEEITSLKTILGLSDSQIKRVSDIGKADISLILGHDYAWLTPYSQLRDQ